MAYYKLIIIDTASQCNTSLMMHVISQVFLLEKNLRATEEGAKNLRNKLDMDSQTLPYIYRPRNEASWYITLSVRPCNRLNAMLTMQWEAGVKLIYFSVVRLISEGEDWYFYFLNFFLNERVSASNVFPSLLSHAVSSAYKSSL